MSAQITIIGNLAADPELNAGQNFHIAKFTVMTSKSKRNQDGSWTNTDSTAWTCSAFDKLADHVLQSVKKGDPVIVVGEVSYRSWEGKDGKPAGRMEVTAKEVGLSMKRFAVSASRRDAGLQPALESDPWATPAPF